MNTQFETSSTFEEINESFEGIVKSRNISEKFNQNKSDRKISKTNLEQALSVDNHQIFYEVEQTNDKFLAIKQYECVVDAIEGDEIIARCIDEDGEDSDFDSAIDLSEIHPDDVKLVKPGAIFYMTIGKNTNSARTEMNDVDIKFKRVVHATVFEKRSALNEADKILERMRLLDGFTGK